MLVAVLESGSFTVGQENALSGLFVSENGGFRHVGWKNVRCFGVAVDPRDGDHIVLACGNGVHQTRNAGTSWRVVTDWRITEVLDIAFDPNDSDHLISASAYGIHQSRDGGVSWSSASDGLESTFVQTVSIDDQQMRIWAGTEDGLFASGVSDLRWARDGLSGSAIRQIVTAGNGRQAVATRRNGAWARSRDSEWTRIEGVPDHATCYTVALHEDGEALAVGGLFGGIYVSLEQGQAAVLLDRGAPDSAVHALHFDEDGVHLVAGTTGAGLFRVNRIDGRWTALGLPETSIRRIL